MISGVLLENLINSLDTNIVNICYVKDNIIYNNYYTKNPIYIKSKESYDNNIENSILVWNMISESFENLELNSIQNFGYSIDGDCTKFIDNINKSKELLSNLEDIIRTKNKKKLINCITNYVNPTCNHSITIKDLFICLKSKELLNLQLSNTQILNFLNKTIGVSLVNKVLFLFLGISDNLELNDPSKLDLYKEKYMNLINERVEKEKITIEEEFNKLKQEFDELNSDEIQCMKEYLDTIKNDYSIFDNKDNIIDIIFNCWPSILAPNPFEFVYY